MGSKISKCVCVFGGGGGSNACIFNLPGMLMVRAWLYTNLMMGCVADTGEVLTVPVSDLTDKSPFTLTSQYPPPEARRIQQQLANLCKWSENRRDPVHVVCRKQLSPMQ